MNALSDPRRRFRRHPGRIRETKPKAEVPERLDFAAFGPQYERARQPDPCDVLRVTSSEGFEPLAKRSDDGASLSILWDPQFQKAVHPL